jgi:UDP-N-acetylglucosamine 2-epimerase (non-hydrolysing)
MSIVGIRPDFIRMSEVFRRLDESFEHILVNTGQHYDRMLSDVFFEELSIRKPDYNLEIGGQGKEHYHQQAELTVKLMDLLKSTNIAPNMILFLGDSNSVTVSVPLKKEGYRIGHIEAGMRSYDRRMLEEINRVVCDHCSDHLFVYHENYKAKAMREGIVESNITVCGNTIVEAVAPFLDTIFQEPKKKDCILLDIHRPENFNHPDRMFQILHYANWCIESYGVPVKMLKFGRTYKKLTEYGIPLRKVELIDLMSFKQYLQAQYDALFLISDSGTAQEEPALLWTPVVVPRDYTERPESMEYGCSVMLNLFSQKSWVESERFLQNPIPKSSWLGDGRTSYVIAEKLKEL